MGKVKTPMSHVSLPNSEDERTGRIMPSGMPLVIEPPLTIEVGDAALRHDRLATLVAEKVVPRLLALHAPAKDALRAETFHAGTIEINELSRLVLGAENADAFDYITRLREAGLSLDNLYLELLEPTARHLGELWDEDKVDFLDVSVGLIRLQRLVRVFAGLDDTAPYDEKCRALIIATPDEQHLFGNAIVQRFFRAAGWHVACGPVAGAADLESIVSREWFGVVGFSIAADRHLENLRNAIAAVRAKSVNRNVGIIVGGPAFFEKPELAIEVGADGTAINAPAAVMLAKKLLVPSLVTGGTAGR